MYEFREGRSTWPNLLATAADWARSPLNKHAIFSVPGVSILAFFADWMHVKYLGTDAYIYGSVLALLVYVLMPGLSSRSTSLFVCIVPLPY